MSAHLTLISDRCGEVRDQTPPDLARVEDVEESDHRRGATASWVHTLWAPKPPAVLPAQQPPAPQPRGSQPGGSQPRVSQARAPRLRGPGLRVLRRGEPRPGAAAGEKRIAAVGDDRGAVTAEYAIVILAGVAFAGLLVAILRSDEVRQVLVDLVQNALGSAG